MIRPFTGRLALAAGLAMSIPVLASPVAAVPAAAATTTYTVTDLGSLGFGVTDALAINATGEVTGYSYLSREIQIPCPPQRYGQPKKCFEALYHAFVWSNGTMTDLGTLGGNFSQGLAINRSGEVVGWAQTRDGSSDAFLSNGRTMTALAPLSAFYPRGINDSGQIAGICNNGSSACVDSNGTITALPDPPNLSCGGAIAINNNGQVLGGCGDASGNLHAVVWTNGTPTVLPTLGGADFAPAAINNNGQVAGYAQTSTGAQHGFLWSNGVLTDLGNNFFVAALNDSDVIIGGNQVFSNGTLQDLDNLLPAGSPYQITYATGINDNGQIVADAFDGTHYGNAVLLTPN